jgi:phosphonate transport system substrate-binding protein
MVRTAALLVMFLLLPPLAEADVVDRIAGARQVLVLGRVSDNPKAHAESMRPMLDYVVPRLRSVGIREGRILMARDATQMQSYLRRQRVDWVSDTAAMAIDYRRKIGADLMLVSVRGGEAYHAVFFTWKGSGIRSLDDLRGRSIAFQNAYSTSSYILPAAAMLREGIALDVLLSPLDRPAPGRAGYLFARSEGNVVTWVQKRLVDAGAFSNLDWDDLADKAGHPQDGLEIFHRSEDVPRSIEVSAPTLDPKVRERLREVLLSAGDDPAAAEALQRFFGTQDFVPLDAGVERSLERLRVDVDLVRGQLE